MRKLLAVAVLAATPLVSHAWGRTGHTLINHLACEKLPADLPAFLRSKTACTQMAYQGPEPDRWRSKATEPELVAAQAPEHFIDLEWAAYAGHPLPRNRYDFIRALAAAQPQHPDIPLTPEKVGLQPYVTTEVWERLKVAMRNYRELSAKHEDTKPVEALVIYYAGWLGHYVGDGSNPMHTSIQYNGWVGPNPKGYTTEHKIHSKFESEFVLHNIKESDVAPKVTDKVVPHSDIFDDYVAYLTSTGKLVEQAYAIEKAKGFDGAGTPEGKAYTVDRLAAGAAELRDLIVFAWKESAKPLPPSKWID